ncbi:MAG: hypothetical protein HYR94_18530 [Chloroflexi bacterium]|nr:hypothetical protein [Chloroflexota bacterium]
MLAVLALLVGIYVGYLNIETPTLAKQFEPTPTPTRPAVLYVGDGDAYFAEGKLEEAHFHARHRARPGPSGRGCGPQA